MSAKKKTLIFVLLLVIALTALLFWPNSAPLRPLPTPNGYDALIAASQQLAEPPDSNATAEQLRNYIAANSNALSSIGVALKMEGMVPTKFVGTQDYMRIHMVRLMNAKTAASALTAEARLAELEMRHDDAAYGFYNAISLGQNVTRNGLAIDMLVGVACEMMGSKSIDKLIPRLTAETCIDLAQRIEELERKREPLSVIQQNEYRFMRSQRDWHSTRAYVRELLAGVLPSKSVLESAWTKYGNQSNTIKLLATRLAAHAYELQNGKKPQTLEDLVPTYLKAVPIDANTGTNLVYKFEN